MNFDYNLIPSTFIRKPGASLHAIKESMSGIEPTLPPDYYRFLTTCNGGEGFIGDDYIILWSVEEVKSFNVDYEVAEYAPGLLLFGSDGGGEGYAFDYRDESVPIVRVPFIGMSHLHIRHVASSFEAFVSQMVSPT